MSIVCVSNLKGGVGKTALAVNSGHALALRGCETLIVDLDPQGGAGILLQRSEKRRSETQHAKIDRSLLQFCHDRTIEVRDGLCLLSLGHYFTQLCNGDGTVESSEVEILRKLLSELADYYDYVIIDTPPLWCGVVAAAIGSASLVIVPTDPSLLSVQSSIDLLQRAQQHTRPLWLLQRTLMNRQAKRVNRIAGEQIASRYSEVKEKPSPKRYYDDEPEPEEKSSQKVSLKGVSCWEPGGLSVYLSSTWLYRSEQVHRQSYLHQTAFDTRTLPHLQDGYRAIARQIESLLAIAEDESDMAEPALATAFAAAFQA
jgi:cellulose biosynthesis protein BcsQ